MWGEVCEREGREESLEMLFSGPHKAFALTSSHPLHLSAPDPHKLNPRRQSASRQAALIVLSRSEFKKREDMKGAETCWGAWELRWGR